MTNQSAPTQWDFLRDAIFKEFPALKPDEGKETMFQFSGSPLEANWGSGTGSIGFTSANSTPAGVGNYYFQSAYSIYKSYRNYLESIDGSDSSLSRAIDNASNAQYNMTFVDGGITTSVPWSSVAAISSALVDWTSAGPDAPPELNVTLSGNSSIQNFLPSPLTSPQIGEQPRNISSLQLILEDQQTRDSPIYKVQIQAIGALTFNVTRKGWFDSSWLSASNVSLKSSAFFTMEDFFGDNGTLVLIPLSILVIYKPKVIITIPEASASGLNLTEDYITVFGMTFSKDSVDVDTSKSGATVITLDSYSDANANPMILGVNSQLFLRQTSEVPKTGSITVKNSGGFFAAFVIRFINKNGKRKTRKSDTFSLGFTKTLQIPADATKIVVKVRIQVTTEWSDIATYKFDQPVDKSYKLTGTTLDAKIEEI